MQLTPTLAGLLNRVWKRDPGAAPALQVLYPGGTMAWAVEDQVLTTTVTGGPGAALTIDLTQYGIADLATYIAGQTGYEVTGLDPDLASLSAMALLDSSGDQSAPIPAFTRLYWSFLDAAAAGLKPAEDCAAVAPQMISVPTAQVYWLDQLGQILGSCVRIPGEPDSLYGPRMIAQLVAPKGNNVAIEAALIKVFGFSSATVTDVVLYTGAQLFDGSITFNGSHEYNTAPAVHYGLFDIVGVYAGPYPNDEVEPYISAFLATLRVAGCHPRNITITDASGNPLTITPL